MELIYFALLWLGIIYVLNITIARKIIPIEPKRALVYILGVGMIGAFGELFLDSVYNHFVGQPLWRYNILPIHDGYTSAYAPVVWGLYGFHVYLLHGTLRAKWPLARARHLAVVVAFEALILESLLTLCSLWLLGDLMYYYYPNDLWHVTSVQNIPFYYICGVLIVKLMRSFVKEPLLYSFLCAWLMSVVVFFTK